MRRLWIIALLAACASVACTSHQDGGNDMAAAQQGGGNDSDGNGSDGNQQGDDQGSDQQGDNQQGGDEGSGDNSQQGADGKDSGDKGSGDKKPKDPRAAMRFPQPVVVGTLTGRRLIGPEESQPVLGHVRGMVRNKDGGNQLVVETGGHLGIGTRLVVVDADSVALLNKQVALIDVDPDDFRKLPAYRSGSLPSLNPGETIRLGVVKPFH